MPNTPRTAFRIGSQTKTFTAVAILRLQEQGRLRVTDPIGHHLPGYPQEDAITLHHLLTNTSGVPDYVTTDGFTRIMGTPRTRAALIADFKDRPLLFEPCARMCYSNSGWVLLGEVIEQSSGLPVSETRFFTRMKGEVELDFLATGEVALNWAGHDVTAHPHRLILRRPVLGAH